jgi:hypothetical protein
MKFTEKEDQMIRIATGYMSTAYVWFSDLAMLHMNSDRKISPSGMDAFVISTQLIDLLSPEEPTFYDVLKDEKYRTYELRRELAFMSLYLFKRADVTHPFTHELFTEKEITQLTKRVDKMVKLAPQVMQEMLMTHPKDVLE